MRVYIWSFQSLEYRYQVVLMSENCTLNMFLVFIMDVFILKVPRTVLTNRNCPEIFNSSQKNKKNPPINFMYWTSSADQPYLLHEVSCRIAYLIGDGRNQPSLPLAGSKGSVNIVLSKMVFSLVKKKMIRKANLLSIPGFFFSKNVCQCSILFQQTNNLL